MPIYEYECLNCGKSFEHLHKRVGSRPRVSCPHCGSKDVRRVISRPGMVKIEWGGTCCGRSEPCDTPPCADGTCRRE
ncbi:zinc ribbon domain-containing protein [candidate division WOR-3 bacterium]|uniref:Zinc ribbon domain-containing protein n=1 Tax=candidate division WOR-3 bacterium TaxID=2052148 RepID=A0A660SFA3_UNCW3|nr:MAG: zinc ribbon domain-containing protein [candidate division WOR-3 bacterium]